MVPLPDGTTFDLWSARVIEEFSLDIPNTLNWRDFADRIILSLPQYDLPQQRGFDDWTEWARRCMAAFL